MINGGFEINLKSLFQKIKKNKLLFIASIVTCLIIGYLYILFSTPQYEAATSILIDSSGNNRELGKSKYVEDGVGLIEVEKNLYNEIGIIKSHALIQKTIENLNLDVSYHTGKLFGTKEHYGHYPFQVSLDRNKPQIFGEFFEVELLDNNRYRITIDTEDFIVTNPVNNSSRIVENEFELSKVYSFGEVAKHDYFSFTLSKPSYNLDSSEFSDKQLSFKIHNSENIASSYSNRIDVNNIDLQASIFRLTAVGPIVSREIDFLNKLTKNYIQSKFDTRDKIASTKASFLKEQLDEAADSLLNAELALESFKRSEGVVDLGATASNALNQTQTLQVDKAKLQLDIRYYNSLIDYIAKNRNADEFAIPSATGINDPLINQSLIQLKNLYAEKSRKKFYVTNNNEEISILNGQINEAIDALLGHLRSGVKSSRLALGSVSSQIDDYSGVMGELPTRQKELLGIQREKELYENLYNYLSEELAKTGIARAESTTDTVILDAPRMVGDGPVSPKKRFITAFALFLGIALPLFKIVFLSKDDEIENVGQIMALTKMPIIATIPRLQEGNKVPESDLSYWKVKEAFRGLAANLKFAKSKESSCVIGITSYLPNEGKTFNSINLGIALAEAGKKTIIVDSDLRLPRIVTEKDKIDGKGLSNYLNGEISKIDQIIHPNKSVKNLKFIPTDVAGDNIHEMLSGSRMHELILYLKKKFDYIIMDTPAVGVVSDFILFSDQIDINLFVLRKGIAQKSFIQYLEDLVENGNKKDSYIIFNDTVNNEQVYGYGKTYGSYQKPPLIKESLSV